VPFTDAVKLGKKLNLSAVFETSAKENDRIDDVFYRAIVNCVDFYSNTGQENLMSSGGPRTRKFSAQTTINRRESFLSGANQDWY